MIRNYLFTCLLGISIYFVVNTVGLEAIINGDEAHVDQFPYQVSVIHDGKNVCGGGIISEQHVLTAAHCFLHKDGTFKNISFSIHAGTIDLHRTIPSIEILKIYAFKNFKPDQATKPGDIAVIKLKHRLKLSKHLAPLVLPNHNDSFTGKTGIVAGFGWHWTDKHEGNHVGGRYDSILRYAEVDILDYAIVGHDKVDLPEYLIHGKVKQRDHHELRGVCLGDSGSPLVYESTVIGILSTASLDCLEQGIGAMYVSVSHYLEFIHYAILDQPHNEIQVYILHQ